MQEIEIRRAVPSKLALTIQANPAVVPGENGEPDEVVVALEIATRDDESEPMIQEAFAVTPSQIVPLIDRLRTVLSETLDLAEELK